MHKLEISTTPLSSSMHRDGRELIRHAHGSLILFNNSRWSIATGTS